MIDIAVLLRIGGLMGLCKRLGYLRGTAIARKYPLGSHLLLSESPRLRNDSARATTNRMALSRTLGRAGQGEGLPGKVSQVSLSLPQRNRRCFLSESIARRSSSSPLPRLNATTTRGSSLKVQRWPRVNMDERTRRWK